MERGQLGDEGETGLGGSETGVITPVGVIGGAGGTPIGVRVVTREDGVGNRLGNQDGGGREGIERK